MDGESVVSSWMRIAPWCCLVRWCRGKYIADKSWFLLLSTSGPHLLELSLIWNLLELVDGRCFFRQSTLERDVMENTVQAGTPAKVSKCDVEQDIELPICNQCNSWLFRCGMDGCVVIYIKCCFEVQIVVTQ